MTEQPQQADSVTCEHHFVSEHQPDMPVYWIRRCSLCGMYDAADLREQIVALPWLDQAREIARELLRDGLHSGPIEPALLRRIEQVPALFWLRGEVAPDGDMARHRE